MYLTNEDLRRQTNWQARDYVNTFEPTGYLLDWLDYVADELTPYQDADTVAEYIRTNGTEEIAKEWHAEDYPTLEDVVFTLIRREIRDDLTQLIPELIAAYLYDITYTEDILTNYDELEDGLRGEWLTFEDVAEHMTVIDEETLKIYVTADNNEDRETVDELWDYVRDGYIPTNLRNDKQAANIITAQLRGQFTEVETLEMLLDYIKTKQEDDEARAASWQL